MNVRARDARRTGWVSAVALRRSLKDPSYLGLLPTKSANTMAMLAEVDRRLTWESAPRQDRIDCTQSSDRPVGAIS